MDNQEKPVYRLERFETKTGIMLNSKNERHFGGERVGLLFNDAEEAKAYVRANLKPGVMFYLYDADGNLIYENVYDEVYIPEIKTKRWWQFWK